jgi:hypothetical protein
MPQVPRTVKKLNVAGCYKLTDDCIPHLPPALEEADFTGCKGISSAYQKVCSGAELRMHIGVTAALAAL